MNRVRLRLDHKIWALMLVTIIGPGVLAGILSIALRSIGFCAKLLYEAIEEKTSLSDRFGLWLGFHNVSQQDYLDIDRKSVV